MVRLRLIIPWLLFMALAVFALSHFLRPLRQTDGFLVPSAGQAEQARHFFAAAIAGGNNANKAIHQDAGTLGLIAKQWSAGTDHGPAFTEDDEICGQGRGSYLLRDPAKAAPFALIAPHRGADRHTGTIALKLFEEHDFQAAAFNTAPRFAIPQCPHHGDVARQPTHFMTAFSLALARHAPHGRIIQLHGFSPAKRGSSAARNADIIVSNGTKTPNARLLDLADCLTRTFPQKNTIVYPIDTQELGAETNAQGVALRDAGYDGFTHLEMSATMRRELAENRQLRSGFGQCLMARG